MRLLPARTKLGKSRFERVRLGIDETLKIGWVGHAGIMDSVSPAGKSGWRLLVRRQQPSHDIEENHHWPGQKRQCDDPDANHRRIEAGVVGDARGDTHDLGVAAIDEETSVHFGFPGLSSGDRQRSGGRNEQKRGDESTGKNGGGGASGRKH